MTYILINFNMYISLFSNQLKVYHHDSRSQVRTVDLPRVVSEDSSPSIVTDSTQDITKGMDKLKFAEQRQSRQKTQTEIRLDEKVLHCSWHPSNNTIAVAGKAGLCLYKV
jgi:hypothetical protein